jgi:hypothetical protein
MSNEIYILQSKIFFEFTGNFIKIGMVYYTDARNSLLLIDFLKKKDLIITGIDTFFLIQDNNLFIQPNMEDDIYYDSKYNKLHDGNYDWEVAKQFIEDKAKKNIIFEIDFNVL